MKLSKTYNPKLYEADIYQLWEQAGAFAPSGSSDTFTIIMPPPNANAPLHIGHALTNAIQDVMVRYNRLKGKATLYLPGADHAGFETWVVYEKQLNKDGKTRFDFSRDQLFKQVWDFVAANRGRMEQQVRAMGASVDWSRYTFTLDQSVVDTTYKTFKKLWDDNLVYRGERIVNYCTVHDTSFSDIEVEYLERDTKLTYINYPLTDGSGQITVATTRPETMLGDTAVAIHPKDKKYKEFIGKTIKLPLTNREIPIVADEAIDASFGTGAVKVTPAHDPTDFDIAQRHDLPAISVIGFDGKITSEAPKKYRGLSVEDARQAVISDLKKLKALAKQETYRHSVGICYKCHNVIEPLLKDQWFIRMQPLAETAIKAIKADKIKFYPAAKKAQALKYLSDVKDWNISRQIAWGIPIPAFRNVDNPDDWLFDERVVQEVIEVSKKHYVRDPDVFDTWFSSGQWPFTTLGYPDGQDFKRFYPTSVMETGGEIFNQWVLRMIMLGLYATSDVPFTTVYIHGYVLAADGTKMSKSLGNVVDPMDVIASHGSDALRMGLISGRVAGVASAFAEDKIIGARNFANKLWNVARYIEGVLGDDYAYLEPQAKYPADDWFIHRLSLGVSDIGRLMDEYRFSEAYERLHHLLWDDLADWYLEASKINKNEHLLAHGLKTLLALAHPFAPFVTETIWQTLSWTEGQLISGRWPKAAKAAASGAEDFELVKNVVTEIRELKSQLRLRQNTLYHQGDPIIAENAELIAKLARIIDCREVESGTGLHLSQPGVEAWLDVEHDVIKVYLENLRRQQTDLESRQKQIKTRLDNKAYIKNAPKALVSESKTELGEIEASRQRIDAQITAAEATINN
ncbi:MAG TPA: valine--tRNA ligase [Candidatus Saccharimonadales bacterium]